MKTETHLIHTPPNGQTPAEWQEALRFTPESYWEHPNPLSIILANISGQARRQMIEDFWDAGEFELLNDELLKDKVSDSTREDLGRIHPFFMGGEYLPDRHPDETTIVRIELNSTTYDVTELRARRNAENQILLTWVDEYESEFFQPEESISQPFTFEELLDFILRSGPEDHDGLCLPLAYNQMNCDCGADRKSLRNFTRCSSDFYPDLSNWTNRLISDWAEAEE